MIQIEKTDIYGWEAAIRGMRNPMNSWDKSDSYNQYVKILDYAMEGKEFTEVVPYKDCEWVIGENDLRLMTSLSKAGDDHGKLLRMITVTCDITAPLYWWKEFDTYKVGTVANSCSTMHKIHAKEFELGDFSEENLDLDTPSIHLGNHHYNALGVLHIVVEALNFYRKKFLETKDKKYWWSMIQLLPSSYNQKRTVQMNYQVLKHMYHARKNHKLDEWREFCEWCKTLPYFMEVCVNE